MTRHHRSIRRHAIRAAVAAWADQAPSIRLQPLTNQPSTPDEKRPAEGWPVAALAAAVSGNGHAIAAGER